MKLFTITGKTLREAIRMPKNLGITLGLPLVFMLIFGLAFGGHSETTYKLAIVNNDTGALSPGFVGGLANMSYDDHQMIFATSNLTDEAAARDGLSKGSYDALVIIPSNFSADALPAGSAGSSTPVPPLTQPQQGPTPAKGAIVTIVGDPSRTNDQIAAQIIAAYSAEFSKHVPPQRAPAVSTASESAAASSLTPFDFIAPGLMVFAILNMIPQASAVLARETENKTLDRVRMSPTGALSLLGGVALAQLILACVSLALMLLMARAMGFHNQGTYASAYVIALVAAIAVTGIGMIIASLAKTQQEAANFGVLVSVPTSFLSGAFFAIPAFTILGFNVYQLLPTTHAVAALRQVMTYGKALDSQTNALAALAGLSLLFFAIGVILYRRTRLTPE